MFARICLQIPEVTKTPGHGTGSRSEKVRANLFCRACGPEMSVVRVRGRRLGMMSKLEMPVAHFSTQRLLILCCVGSLFGWLSSHLETEQDFSLWERRMTSSAGGGTA